MGLQASTAHRFSIPAVGCEPLNFARDKLARFSAGFDDRVAQATTGGTVQARYVYDSQGRMLGDYLAGATAAGTRGEYIYINPDAANDNASPFGGDDGMGGYGLLAVATKDAANAPVIHYIHSNHLGVPILTLNSTGAVIAAGTYTQPVFPGQMKTYTDLYYNRYRDYDPTTGRYIQADPIGLDGGDNPYLYAEGNPVRYVDPMGLEILNLFPDNEPGMRDAANRHYRSLPPYIQNGGLHIYGHGSPTTQCDMRRSRCDTAEEFSNKLLMNKKYKYRIDQKVYLYSCNTGATSNGFAQKLSDFLQVDVYAPNKYTWYVPYSRFVASAGKGPFGLINPFSPGKMQKFSPQ